MSTNDQDGGGLGFFDRMRRRFSGAKSPSDCDHPHVRSVGVGDVDPHTGGLMVCATCGRPLDANDPTLRRRQHLSEAKVCVDCGGTYWTTGTRRSL